MTEIYECRFCGTQFVSGVADPGPGGEPRCPQCLLCDAVPVPPGKEREFVVTMTTPFL
jgi:hypothetical protein